MASLASPLPISSRIFTELLERQRMLALYGVALLIAALPVLVLQLVDPRTLHGINVWVKPVKFLVSVGVFSITAAWFFGYIRPERRRALSMRVTVCVLIAMGSFELIWISWQAGQGLDSHFNTSTTFFTAMYALMGISAVFLVGTTLPIAWEIGRRPIAGIRTDFIAAVVIGLLMTFVLGGGLGGYMSSQAGHSVGMEGGHVPVFGWNRSGGDLRIAHFMGIHAEQAIPILVAMAAPLAARLRWLVLAGGVTVYIAATLEVFAQAVEGRALLPL
jgi:hypothetical protein